MSPDNRPSLHWRAVKDGCTRNLRGSVETVVFPNPGREPVLYFHGQYYWHEPLIGGVGEVIGHELQWSLVPNEYKFGLVARDLVGSKP